MLLAVLENGAELLYEVCVKIGRIVDAKAYSPTYSGCWRIS
jgi:hypothetical protein